MKRFLPATLMVLFLALIAAFLYLKFALPNVGKAPDLKVDVTQDKVERGQYLAYHVSVCMDCHSTRDWSKYSGPLVTATNGKGGEFFGEDMGFPGNFYSKNITPFHLKGWTDGEIFRAITTGVSKDGSALFPVMPYTYYGQMDKEDIYSIIAFLRTLPEIESTTPQRSINFPVNLLVNTMPKKANPHPLPLKSDTLAYGAYLTTAAGCAECHTPAKNGALIEDKAFQGGRDFKMPGLTVYSSNITPDFETGIGGYSAEDFVAKFKAFSQPGATPTVTPGAPQTLMPWTMYAGMDTTDLVAIYRYLMSLPPVKNKVEHFVMDKGE